MAPSQVGSVAKDQGSILLSWCLGCGRDGSQCLIYKSLRLGRPKGGRNAELYPSSDQHSRASDFEISLDTEQC